MDISPPAAAALVLTRCPCAPTTRLPMTRSQPRRQPMRPSPVRQPSPGSKSLRLARLQHLRRHGRATKPLTLATQPRTASMCRCLGLTIGKPTSLAPFPACLAIPLHISIASLIPSIGTLGDSHKPISAMLVAGDRQHLHYRSTGFFKTRFPTTAGRHTWAIPVCHSWPTFSTMPMQLLLVPGLKRRMQPR